MYYFSDQVTHSILRWVKFFFLSGRVTKKKSVWIIIQVTIFKSLNQKISVKQSVSVDCELQFKKTKIQTLDWECRITCASASHVEGRPMVMDGPGRDRAKDTDFGLRRKQVDWGVTEKQYQITCSQPTSMVRTYTVPYSTWSWINLKRKDARKLMEDRQRPLSGLCLK